MKMRCFLFGAMLMMVFFATACGSETSDCVPGRSVACECPEGQNGYTLCSDEGSFEGCLCVDGPRDVGLVDGGVDDVGVNDVGLVDAGVDDAGAFPDIARDGAVLGPETPNACGGASILRQGEVGEPCGQCGEGLWICDGEETLRCAQSRARNACGSCKPLRHAVGDFCGPCGEGRWGCGDDGELYCVGDSPLNACGGCSVLGHWRGGSCTIGDGSGLWTCAGLEELRCVGPDRNPCGGTSDLEGVPGQSCGACDGGRWVCDGAERVVCDNPDRLINPCGGCTPLEAKPGDPCGECDGAWVCDGIEALRCSENLNLCGACNSLAQIPGQSCGQGSIFACQGQSETACLSETEVNACGGAGSLEAEPGSPCGPCNDGYKICASPDSVVCIGAALSPNGCDGCGSLRGEPGTSCGLDQRWLCDPSGGNVVCGPPQENPCGGTAILPGVPGEVCEECGVWQCHPWDEDRLDCIGGSHGLDVDSRNCTACGNRCVPGTSCLEGQCVFDKAIEISAGRNHTCVLRESGRVACWGRGPNGALGQGHYDHLSRAEEVIGLYDAVEIAVGETFTCAVRANGRVACWGTNGSEQMGLHWSFEGSPVPVDIPTLEGVHSISAGANFACGINAARRAVCWGRNNQGQLGQGETDFSSAPTEVINLEDVVKVIVNGHYPSSGTQANMACAIVAGGNVWCWGIGAQGRLGHGTTTNSLVPVPAAGLSDALELSTSANATCARRSNGEAWCWGLGSQTGNEDESNAVYTTPVQVSGLEGVSKLAKTSGTFNCAIDVAGDFWCWGTASSGLQGDGTSGGSHFAERIEFFRTMNVVDFSGGLDHLCVLNDLGQVYCLGAGQSSGSGWGVGPLLGDGQPAGSAMRRYYYHEVLGVAQVSSESGQCRDGIDNDRNGRKDCADPACAIDLGGQASIVFSSVFRGDEGNYFQGSCGTSNGREQVYTWTAPTTGQYVISTAGSQLATVLYVLDTCEADVADAELACDVDSAADGRSELRLSTLRGQTYMIVVDSSSTASFSTYALSIREALP